jgi:hypothetical protein
LCSSNIPVAKVTNYFLIFIGMERFFCSSFLFATLLLEQTHEIFDFDKAESLTIISTVLAPNTSPKP